MSGLCEWQRRFLSVCLICLLCFAVYACGQKQDPMEKIKDLEYTVIAEDNIPEELLEKIEERNNEIRYGKQKGAGDITLEDAVKDKMKERREAMTIMAPSFFRLLRTIFK